jgi:hypothetical protein
LLVDICIGDFRAEFTIICVGMQVLLMVSFGFFVEFEEVDPRVAGVEVGWSGGGDLCRKANRKQSEWSVKNFHLPSKLYSQLATL